MTIEEKASLLSLRRMAVVLGVPPKWLREAAEARKVPGLLAGDRWIFDRASTTAAVRSMASRAECGEVMK